MPKVNVPIIVRWIVFLILASFALPSLVTYVTSGEASDSLGKFLGGAFGNAILMIATILAFIWANPQLIEAEILKKLNKFVGPNFKVEDVVRPNGKDGWKILRNFHENTSVLGMDLIPVALIKKDFAGIRVINQDADVLIMLKDLTDAIEKQFNVDVPMFAGEE